MKSALLEASVLAAAGGAAVAALYPPYMPIAAAMGAASALGITHYITTHSRFDRLWGPLGLCKGEAYPILKEKKKTEYSIIYKFTLPAGLSSEDFERKKTAIEQFCGRDIEIKYTYKEIMIEVFEKSKTTYDFEVSECPGLLGIPIGYDRKGKLITCDLSRGEPHLLIAGETGAGKSTALRAIITNLILTKNVKLHLIDLKRGAEFQIFAKCKKVATFARTKAEAEDTLRKISAEINRRYDLFFAHDCINIKEYNSKKKRMGYEVLIIDEFADFQSEKESIRMIEDIAAKARACGIHLIISTQRPDHIILNGRIKANVTSVLGLKTMNEVNSRIIIDRAGLEELRGSGHAIFKRGQETEVQCPFLVPETARELLRPTYGEIKRHLPIPKVFDFDFLEAL